MIRIDVLQHLLKVELVDPVAADRALAVVLVALLERRDRVFSWRWLVRSALQDDGMPAESTVRLWVLDDVEGFAAQYARARLVGYHTMADDLIEIADNPETEAAAVNRDRLKVDTRKWLLSKALPKIYGDKLTAEVTGKDGDPIKTEQPSTLELARQIAFIFNSGMRELEEGEGEPGAKAVH